MDARAPVQVVTLLVGGPAQPWRDLGFAVNGETIGVGRVTLRLAPEAEAEGIVGWELSGLRSARLDGLPTVAVAGPSRPDPVPSHANGAIAIDHVVVSTPRLERTLAALEGAGLRLRRRREVDTPQGTLHQAFFRLGEVILEVVAPPQAPPGPADFWGLVFVVRDLEACAAALGDRLGPVRDAVQPGRRIATVRRDAGLGLPVALMSPDSRAHPRRP